MSALFAVIAFALFIVAFGCLLLGVANLLGPKAKPNVVRDLPYESGIIGESVNDTKISVKFYLTAILFIIFDIEIIFMYPWAVTYMDAITAKTGGYMLAAMGLFVVLFVIGLIWEVKSKALEWD